VGKKKRKQHCAAKKGHMQLQHKAYFYSRKWGDAIMSSPRAETNTEVRQITSPPRQETREKSRTGSFSLSNKKKEGRDDNASNRRDQVRGVQSPLSRRESRSSLASGIAGNEVTVPTLQLRKGGPKRNGTPKFRHRRNKRRKTRL